MGNPVPRAPSWILSSLPVIGVLLGSQLGTNSIFFNIYVNPGLRNHMGNPVPPEPLLLEFSSSLPVIAVLLGSHLEQIKFF